MNDAVDWSRELGGQCAASRSSRRGRSGPTPATCSGPCRGSCGAASSTDEVDDKRRLLQALNCLLIETPSGRVVVETGIGERLDDKTRAMRSYEGPWIASVLETVGFMPESVNIVALSHLHFDHAGGLLRADGSRTFPHAKIVAQHAEWEVALGDNPRLVASYVQPELKLVETLGKQGWADGEEEIMPGVSVVPTGGHSAGHQAIVVRGTGDGARTLAFFGDLMMRPWAANPRWVTAFDDFPLDSVVQKAALFARPPTRTGSWCCRTRRHPIGRLVRDRDRFRYEPDRLVPGAGVHGAARMRPGGCSVVPATERSRSVRGRRSHAHFRRDVVRGGQRLGSELRPSRPPAGRIGSMWAAAPASSRGARRSTR